MHSPPATHILVQSVQMLHNWTSSESQCTSSKRAKRNRTCNRICSRNRNHSWSHPGSSMVKSNTWLLLLAMLCLINFVAKADETAQNGHGRGRVGRHLSTTPLSHTATESPDTATESATVTELAPTESATELAQEEWQPVVNATQMPMPTPLRKQMDERAGSDSVLLRLARRFTSGNELWNGIIRDCYLRPDISCFQKNVFSYLNDALDVQDVNVTQRLKFFKNQVQYEADKEQEQHNANEIPNRARAAPLAETPIEEVTTALYGKSIKFAMTHDLEVDLPEVMFNGATFRISPRSIEGNGIIAKLELIPKQVVKARLAGMIIQKKIQKFLRSKIVLSFLALLLIIKIIKIKLFWLLPIVIGVGAAKKLLLKFLLFLFPALSHLFKLCSHYQQSYHAPLKYHHHHHLIDHHHTVVPPWHSGEHQSVPDIIYTHPPKGHPSAYLHGAPVHESHGPGFEHFEGAWENSGPGLGSEYIGDINRAAQIEDNPHYFKPNTANDAGVLHAWGLGTTQTYPKQPQNHPQQHPQQQQQRWPATQQSRPPTAQQHKPQLQHQQQQQQQKFQQQLNAQKVHASSHSLNPFQSQDKQSSRPAYTQPHPVYVPGHQQPQLGPGSGPGAGLTAAAQIAAQYEPARNNQQQQQQPQQQHHQNLQEPQLSPELAAQLKEAIRIQAEQRLIQQQQKILEHQPFVQDGQPLYPLNYDPFYSPILLKIDKIVEQLGVKNDLCKERIVCSMYKDPATYSPHSNFVSAELSRDTSELEPVTHANEAVRRFYRLIQAARDGQDQKDCQSLYPQCTMPAK
ncbi:uncharacterized protein LOC108157723 isoform X1 [Drosophila miranda]|uniref:uncharacterized protein LOC108157723 isoform X1 n=1 Tax=Drosophila miranda TaxID=7229 RepID=UPI0007E7B471|nr:uncharacterized protein LOC108157723 isoform X1 [Drosophila miranda]